PQPPVAAEKADEELERELSELEASADASETEDPAQAPLPEGALREPADLHDERLGGNPAFAVGTDVQPWSLPQDVVAPDIVLSEMVRTARLPRRMAARSRKRALTRTKQRAETRPTRAGAGRAASSRVR